MITFRKSHPCIGRATFWREDVSWYGADGPVDLGHESRCLAYALRGASVGDDDLYVMIDAHWENHSFTVSDGKASGWRRVVDTARASPEDIVEPGTEPVLATASYMAKGSFFLRQIRRLSENRMNAKRSNGSRTHRFGGDWTTAKLDVIARYLAQIRRGDANTEIQELCAKDRTQTRLGNQSCVNTSSS
jgi:hypothetical protein